MKKVYIVMHREFENGEICVEQSLGIVNSLFEAKGKAIHSIETFYGDSKKETSCFDILIYNGDKVSTDLFYKSKYKVYFSPNDNLNYAEFIIYEEFIKSEDELCNESE